MFSRVMMRLIVVLGASLAASSASAQSAGGVKPLPPSQVCIEDAGTQVCSGTPVGPTTLVGKMKWNPGNYVRADIQGFGSLQQARFDSYSAAFREPLIKGAVMLVNWGVVENGGAGRYDFSVIDRELEFVRSKGRRLILEVWWHSFASNDVPAVPQQSDFRYLPDYVISGGGAAPSAVYGYMARIHDPKWMDRLIALFQELGRRYNGDPAVEQIIISETSMNLRDPTFTADALTAQFKRLIPKAREAFPNTPVVIYMNWAGTQQSTTDLLAFGHQSGIGMGGPDILPPPPSGPYEDWGSQSLRGAGGSFGSVDYRGRIPVSYSFENPVNQGMQLKPDALYSYASSTLRATHLAWTYFTYKLPEQNWETGVLPAIRARNGAVATACPTIYQGTCASTNP